MNTPPPPKPTLLPSHPPEIKISHTSFSSYSERPGEILVLRKSKPDDKELEVFDAEKYFSEADHIPDKVHVPTHHTKDNPTLEIFKVKEPHPLTPTASVHSQSSLNSRSALLHTLSISGNQRKQKKANMKSFLAAIGCKCSCADLNSVETNDRFVKQPPAPDHVKPDAVAKRSKPLEVFGSRDTGENGKMCSLTEEVKIPSISSEMYVVDDGNRSDDSSDLFEIESLTRGDPHAYNHFLSMQTSDGCKSPACYAPSEASVEWSVITASAADFSVLSDSEELTQPKKNTSTFKEMPRPRKSGLLSGCVSQKALRVSGEGDNVEHGFDGNRRNLRTENFTTRFGLRNRQQPSMEARVFSRQAARPLYA